MYSAAHLSSKPSQASRIIRSIPCLVLIISLAGCAAAPRVAEKNKTFFDDAPETASPLSALVSGNEGSGVSLLADPADALESRLQLAALAQSSLDLQYYLWQGDDSGMALTHEVLRAADRGVRVRILLDDIYHSGRDSAYKTLDVHPNVEVRLFNPMGNRGSAKTTNYAFNKSTLNYRMHNKIFLVDGQAAIMGGRNIGDEYFGHNTRFNFQDMDAIAVGEVAREAGAAFDLFWNAELAIPVSAMGPGESVAATEVQLSLLAAARERLRPEGQSQDHRVTSGRWLEALSEGLLWTRARVIVDRPDRGREYPDSAFTSFSSDPDSTPSDSVVIQTAYLIPNGPTLGNLQAFVAQGVQVRILTNSAQSTNHNSVHAYYAPYRKALLRAGVDLFEVQGDGALASYLDRTEEDARAGLHTKAMVIDERISVIGSYNMDPRSRVWNSEIALVVEDRDFAAEVLEEMARDFSPDAAWQLSLDEGGQLVWTGEFSGETVHLSRDPGSSWWDRFLWSIMRVLPFENEL